MKIGRLLSAEKNWPMKSADKNRQTDITRNVWLETSVKAVTCKHVIFFADIQDNLLIWLANECLVGWEHKRLCWARYVMDDLSIWVDKLVLSSSRELPVTSTVLVYGQGQNVLRRDWWIHRQHNSSTTYLPQLAIHFIHAAHLKLNNTLNIKIWTNSCSLSIVRED